MYIKSVLVGVEKMIDVYKLLPNLLGRLKNNGKSKCSRCATEFRTYEVVVSTARHGNYYHEKCAINANLI